MAFCYSASFEQTEVTTPKKTKLESYLGNFQEKRKNFKKPLFRIYSGKHFAKIYEEKLHTEPWELLPTSRELSNPGKPSVHRS